VTNVLDEKKREQVNALWDAWAGCFDKFMRPLGVCPEMISVYLKTAGTPIRASRRLYMPTKPGSGQEGDRPSRRGKTARLNEVIIV
jgi:hypothetical protein